MKTIVEYLKQDIVDYLPDESVDVLGRVDPSLFEKSEDELESYCSPTPSLNRVRIHFQRMYQLARDRNIDRIDWVALAESADVSPKILFKMFCEKESLVWILTPVVGVHKAMDEMFYTVLNKLRKAIETPIFNEEGKLDTKAGNFLLKVFTHLEKRQFGEFRQEIEHKVEEVAPKKVEDVDVEIKHLEDRIKELEYLELEDEQQEDTARERVVEAETQEVRGVRVKKKKG